jgi:hypothetical protein
MSCPVYCKGCIYRTPPKQADNMCEYSIITGKLRGCPAGEGCIRKDTGEKKKHDWNQPPNLPKRKKLTDEERRERRNALRRKEYANKKAALSLQTESGAVEN